MKYKPNLWTLVDRIQCGPDQRNIERREVFDEKSPRLERELKNAYHL